VKLAVSQNHNTLLSKGEWKEAYALVVKGDTTPDDLLWTGNDTSVFSGSSVPLNTWAHVAMTINNDLTTFYMNGQVSGAANQDRGNAIDNTTAGVSIGREQYAGSMPAGRWFFNGRVDDVRIYERVLTQTEIQAAMVGEPAAAPGISSFSLEGSNFVIRGTNGMAGGTCFVLASTNVAAPLSNWTRVWTNTFDGTGSMSVTSTVSAGEAQRFYRLQLGP
jgi:Concanavalin A-like lectin/glucanases superfamily